LILIFVVVSPSPEYFFVVVKSQKRHPSFPLTCFGLLLALTTTSGFAQTLFSDRGANVEWLSTDAWSPVSGDPGDANWIGGRPEFGDWGKVVTNLFWCPNILLSIGWSRSAPVALFNQVSRSMRCHKNHVRSTKLTLVTVE